MSTVNLSAAHGDFVAKQIKYFAEKQDLLFSCFANATSYRSIFCELYRMLVNTGQIEAIEALPVDKKQLVWKLACSLIKETEYPEKTKAERTAVSKAIYLVKLLLNEY